MRSLSSLLSGSDWPLNPVKVGSILNEARELIIGGLNSLNENVVSDEPGDSNTFGQYFNQSTQIETSPLVKRFVQDMFQGTLNQYVEVTKKEPLRQVLLGVLLNFH